LWGLELLEEGADLAGREVWWWREEEEEIWLTVESWSWISIMWSPRRIVRFSGAAPDRKSFTCDR
jgi:hypothetical protein